jgi:ubiquinone/menaquinone biosynthesis C-methylase UbiE
MTDDIFFEIHKDLPREGPGKNACTQKAFQMLPKLDKPNILDIGCGPGMQTMELARLSNGQVIGLDNHQPFLDELNKRIETAGIGARIKAVNGSMFDLAFPDESFDIIWAEGSIFIIGFERGLKEWRRLIKPGGFLAVTEATWLQQEPPQEIFDYWQACYPAITSIQENLKFIESCGYKPIGHFALPDNAWWDEYYYPLEQRIQMLQQKYKNNQKAIELLDSEILEQDMFRKYSKWYGYVFYIMQK